MHLTLADGKVIQRVFAGYIASEDDLAKFVAEARKELQGHTKQNPLLCEIWEYEGAIKVRRRLPTVEEEMTAEV